MNITEQRSKNPSSRVLVRISVHAVGGKAYEGPAEVILTREGKATELKREKSSVLYQGHVEPGSYRLQVRADKWVAPARTVEVGSKGKDAAAYLGEPGWPFYRLGENAIPFPPPGNLVAMAFPRRKPGPDEERRIVDELSRRLSLKPVQVASQPSQRREPRSSAILLFSFGQTPTPELFHEAVRVTREVTNGRARTGVPVDTAPGQMKIIDNRFVVRFKKVAAGRLEEEVKKAGAEIVRRFAQSPDARLIEFPAGDFRQHLAQIETWHEQGLLVYGEPDIMAQITDDAFPDDAPNDPTFANQVNLTLQQVDVAWRIMRTLGVNQTLGTPAVHVATLDRGPDLDHPDIGGNLTDGNPQISRSFDFDGMRECTAPGYAPDTSHGMGVYGIVAARANNGEDITGIAPNTHQIALERPDLTDASYPDILLWAAGFTTGNDDPDWPAEPLSPAASIISCSHGSDGLALSGIMDDTFIELATNGRGGLGTLVVYSAGNGNALITGFRTWAAHPNTLAIANSMQPGGDGVERRDPTSNFGPEIDVCAQGTNAPSLDDVGGEQTFGGTSAAAPTVAAIAALIFSRDPSLTWDMVRDILRETAVPIDVANTDPVGQWVGNFSQWYGFGRVNAANAVCGVEPLVTLETPSINFNDVPEGETTVRAAVFTVESCQPLTLEIIDGPGAPFTTPLGTSDELGVSADSSRQGRIWIGYTGTTDGDTASNSVTVRCPETNQDFDIPITANTVSRPTVCLELVLDQSGSMSFNSGIPTLPQRIDVLKFSVPPLLEVIHDDNALGVVSFDTDAFDVMPITEAGPSVFGAGRVAARIAVDNHTPNLAGLTAIGDGVERAHDHLVLETDFDVRAMIVFTDGHETAAQYIADVDDLINERVYAIGLGTADQIQPAALTALTNGTGGYLLLTGELGATDYFLLAKYYLQILAGVSNEDIVTDPEGAIAPGQKHRLGFRLSETDISSDVILLSPAPEVIRFALETPAGDLITSTNVSGFPGSTFVVGRNVSYYRLSLPVPIGSGAAAGQWHAILDVDERLLKRYLARLEKDKLIELIRQIVTHGVGYSVSVHTYSNLRLRASVSQNSLEPGATLHLRAALTEYGLPVERRARVRAEVKRPDSTTTTLALSEVQPGVFETSLNTTLSGVYQFRVRANGRTLRHRPFTREQILTGAVWRGGNNPPPSSATDPGAADAKLCALLECLLGGKVLRPELIERLRESGVDMAELQRCIKRFCSGR